MVRKDQGKSKHQGKEDQGTGGQVLRSKRLILLHATKGPENRQNEIELHPPSVPLFELKVTKKSKWKTDFYTPPVLGGAAPSDNSAAAVYKNPVP